MITNKLQTEQSIKTPFYIEPMYLKNATIDIVKLCNYALDEEHPTGKHKAKKFKSLLGLTKNDAEWLKMQIMSKIQTTEAVESKRDDYGIRYVADFEIENGFQKAYIRTVWLLGNEANVLPRLITCFII